MKTLGKLLGSAARTEVLRVLTCQPGPLGLRPTARVAGIHPRSAELALRDLVREQLVRSRPTAAGPVYEINRRHPDTPVLEAVFDAAARAAVHQRRASLQRKARAILPFVDEADRMLSRARDHRHVT